MIHPLNDADAAAMPLTEYGPLKAPTGVPLDGPMMTSGEVFFRHQNGHVVAGIWEVTAGRMRADFGDDGEMVHIVKGTLKAIPDEGESFTLHPGDTATFEPHWKGIWDLETPMRKLFCVFNFNPA